MPLDATRFYVKGPVNSADLRQFYDLFTGAMSDQPVTFVNTLSVGGSQGVTTVPLRIFGAPGQNTNLLDLYLDRTSAQPSFGFSAVGQFAWGPGAASPQDTFLSRIAQQHGHVGADSSGLLITPQLEVAGYVRADADIVVDNIGLNAGTALAPGLHFGQFNAGEGIGSQRSAGGGGNQYGLDFWAGGVRRMLITQGGNVSMANSLTVGGAIAATGTVTGSYLHTTDGGNGIVIADAGSLYLRSANQTVVIDGTNGLNLSGLLLFANNGYYLRGINGVAALETNGNLQVDGGILYMEASRAVIIQYRPDLGAIYIPYGNGIYTPHVLIATGNLWMEASKQVYLHFDGTNVTMNMAGPWGFATPNLFTTTLHIGQAVINSPNVNNVHIVNANLSLEGNRIIQLNSNSGGAAEECSVSPGTNIGHTGAVYLSPHAYVFFDLGVGHVVTCQQVIQTSDPSLKANATIISDADCMLRIRGNVPVYSYQLPPPSPAPPETPTPTPTPTDVGMMADDVFANSPEFAALDGTGKAVGVNYANMSAMVWGALRQLDARCTAKGI